MLKKIVSIFLLIFLVGEIAIAQESKAEFQPIKAGEVAHFDGYLFSPKAASHIVSKTEEEINKLKLNCDNRLTLASIESERVLEIQASQARIEQQLLKETISVKDRIIENNVKTIKNLETSIVTHKIFIIAGFVTGIVLTGTIAYYTVGLTK